MGGVVEHVTTMSNSKASCFRVELSVDALGFDNYSQFRSRGGVIENQFFPKFKKVQIILGGGGSKKLWTFSTIYGILYSEPSP